jgi:hypothetical protein
MPDSPAYAILGHGRWAHTIRDVLTGEGRRCVFIEDARRETTETDSDYKQRLAKKMADSGSHIAWLCTLPGPHVLLLIEAAIGAGLHVIAEKPWPYSPNHTRTLQDLAAATGRQVGVHFEYCLLDAVEKWRNQFDRGAGLRFGGRFHLRGQDRLGIPAADNLGCHLLAIREYAVPQSRLAAISCEYERADERRVWLETNHQEIAPINFLGSKEPIIQRYVAKFERGLDGAAFPFDLEFGARTAAALSAWKLQGEKPGDP